MRKNKKSLADRVVDIIIQCNPMDFATLTVSALAEQLGVSVPHLSRNFKNDRGTTLKEFLDRGKIAHSQFLLMQHKKLSIKGVAECMDFCSSDYFIKVFKKYVGVSPGKYREFCNSFPSIQYWSPEVGEERRLGRPDRRSGIERRQSEVAVDLERRHVDFGNGGDRRVGPDDRRTSFPL